MSNLDDTIEVTVYREDGSSVFGVLNEWQKRDGAWVAAVTVYEGGSTHREWVPADRVERLEYCTWWQGQVSCRQGCGRPYP